MSTEEKANHPPEKNVEILQISCLEDYIWPVIDPHSIPQRMRKRLDTDLTLIKDCIKSAKLDMDAFLKNANKESCTPDELVLRILSHQKFQMNPMSSVRNDSKWKACIKYSMDAGVPIDIVYPQFCVIPNAPKRYTNTGYSAGEDCTIEFFKQINEQVKVIYPPGVTFHTLADAALYANGTSSYFATFC